jgi:hypothetical protein
MSEHHRIRYRIELPNGTQQVFDFQFDEQDFRLRNAPPPNPPFWTQLDYNKCANCPLDVRDNPHCPPALHMVDTVERLATLVSFDIVSVTVTMPERTMHAEVSAQQAMSSILGLIMATSGCPWTGLLRPMARFHLPFASELETVYRSLTMYLLAKELADAPARGGFESLQSLYETLHVVNRDMSRRLGAATRSDPARNALALLDSYSTLLPAAIEGSLAELRPLFDSWKIPLQKPI